MKNQQEVCNELRANLEKFVELQENPNTTETELQIVLAKIELLEMALDKVA